MNKIRAIRAFYQHDPLRCNWIDKNPLHQLKLIQTWCDLLATRYMRERYTFNKNMLNDYQINHLNFYAVLLLKSPTPKQYLLRIEDFFMQITDCVIPDEYIPYTLSSTTHSYRHFLSHLAKNKVKLSVTALNPLLVNALSEYSTGYHTTKYDRIPSETTLIFIKSMLTEIEKDQRLLNLINKASHDEKQLSLILGNLSPIDPPEKSPIWSKKIYARIFARLQSLYELREQNLI